MCKKTVSLFLSFILMISLLIPCVLVSAAQSASFKMNDVNNIGAGQEFSVNIYLDSPESIQISGLNFVLSYDSEKLEYTENSLRSSVFSGISSYSNNGKVSFVWEDSQNKTVLKGSVISLNFRCKDSFNGNTQLKLDCISAYSCKYASNKLVFEEICPQGTIATANVTTGSDTDPAVAALIEKINAIGTVTATEECKNMLDALLAEYNALSYSNKKKVTNYSVLVAAYNKYTELCQNDGALTEEINAFLIANSKALALRASTVTVDDKEIVNKALDDWDKLSVSAKLKLTTQRSLLKNLLAIITELDAENQKRLEQERLQREAEQMAADFRSLNSWVLELKESDIMADHREGLQKALSELEEMEFFNDLAYQIFVKDGTIERLNRFYNKAKELYDALHPADAEYIDKAENFKASFGYILNVAPADLSYDDVADVNLAYMVYSFLDEKTKGYLKNEAALLDALMSAADLLSPDDDEDGNSDTETITETVTEVKTVKDTKYITRDLADRYDLLFSMKGMSNVVWILLAIEGASLILLAGSLLMYYFTKKRKKTEEDAI